MCTLAPHGYLFNFNAFVLFHSKRTESVCTLSNDGEGTYIEKKQRQHIEIPVLNICIYA